MSLYKSYVVESPNAELKCIERSLEDALASIPKTGAIVKTLYAGVCHTDLHYIEGHYTLSDTEKIDFNTRPGYQFPKVPGHEVCGEVYALGSDVPSSCNVGVGDIVCVFAWMRCGDCAHCDKGETDYCTGSGTELGMTYDGGYSQFVTVPQYRCLVPLPANIPAELGCTLSCSCLTVYSACQAMLENTPDTMFNDDSMQLEIAVIGLGGLGQWCLKLLPVLLKAKGSVSYHITGLDVNEARLDEQLKSNHIANKFVIDPTLTPVELAKQIVSKTIPQTFHAVIDFVNNPLTFTAANRILRSHGVLVSVGLFGGTGEVRLPLLSLRQHTIIGIQTGGLNGFRDMLDFIHKLGTGLEGPAIDVFELSDCNKVIDDLRKGRIRGRAILNCS